MMSPPTPWRELQAREAAEAALAAGRGLSRVLAMLQEEWCFHASEWQYATLQALVSPPLYWQGLRYEVLALRDYGLSWRAIAADFNARGIPRPDGKRWTWSAVRALTKD